MAKRRPWGSHAEEGDDLDLDQEGEGDLLGEETVNSMAWVLLCSARFPLGVYWRYSLNNLVIHCGVNGHVPRPPAHKSSRQWGMHACERALLALLTAVCALLFVK